MSYPQRPGALAFHATTDPERLLHHADGVRMGTFRCSPSHPDFSTAGQIEGYTIVFPRTAVWIAQEGHRPFVADPSLMVLYNKGHPYTRRAIDRDGDRADWYSVEPDVAAGIVLAIDPDADPTRPFAVGSVPAPGSLFLRQRRLLRRVQRGTADRLLVEQEVLSLFGDAVRAARRISCEARLGRRRDVVEAVRAEIARDPLRAITVRALALAVDISPFHLCRIFRALTGRTLHDHVLELRLRHALERIGIEHDGLSRIALDMGFSSHSHFTAAFRRRFGLTPSQARRELALPGLAIR
jgi:AraC-like DNA-binding protein